VDSHHSAAHAGTHPTAATALVFAAAFLAALGYDLSGSLTRDREARWDGREVQRLPDEVAERDDEFRGLDRVTGDRLARGAGGELNLFFGSEQNDVRERGLDDIVDSPRALASGRVGSVLQIPLVPRVDFEAAREGAPRALYAAMSVRNRSLICRFSRSRRCCTDCMTTRRITTR